jgi:hypothetical protein
LTHAFIDNDSEATVALKEIVNDVNVVDVVCHVKCNQPIRTESTAFDSVDPPVPEAKTSAQSTSERAIVKG